MSRVEKHIARALDFGMCAMMNAVQFRHRLHASSREELEAYIAQCEPMTREEFFLRPSLQCAEFSFSKKRCYSKRSEEPLAISGQAAREQTRNSERFFAGAQNDSLMNGAAAPFSLSWQSSIRTAFAENNRVHVHLFPCARGWSAPTILMLHALMSASDVGYRLWAKRFNERGWNACFVHLPYHYSRRPRGFFNGELAISADLVRTAEGLRQGVVELRQLMEFLRERGSREFALWATSYGGWIGALLLAVEHDFRFAAFMAPIVNIEHAIWKSPAAARLRAELRRSGITQALVERHFHLTSPMHSEPLCGGERVLFAAGDYDQIALSEDIAQLHKKWRGSRFLRVAQGHFGYRMMREMFAVLAKQERF